MKHIRFALFTLLLALLVLPMVSVTPVNAQDLGTNWLGSFYANTTASGTPVVTNISFPTGLNENWGDGPPRDDSNVVINGMPSDNWSAVFTSTQNFTTAGNYTFTVLVDDGVRVTVDGQVVIDSFVQYTGGGPYATLTGNINIQPGARNIRVEYVDFTGAALLQVSWRLAGQTQATATPTPAATGAVVRVRGLAVRTGPYLGASLVAVARPNNAYPILEINNDEGLFTWYKIRVGDSIGWSSGRYLEVTGNLDVIPTTSTVFQSLNGAPPEWKGIVGVTRSVMNFRLRPSQRTQLLGQIPWGDEVEVLGRTLQGGESYWLLVRYNGQIGWIYAPFIGIRGLIEAVPVY